MYGYLKHFLQSFVGYNQKYIFEMMKTLYNMENRERLLDYLIFLRYFSLFSTLFIDLNGST